MDEPVNPVEAFIARWQGADGRERANYQLFLTELTAVLDLRDADTGERLPTILDTLVAIGRARSDGSGRYTST